MSAFRFCDLIKNVATEIAFHPLTRIDNLLKLSSWKLSLDCISRDIFLYILASVTVCLCKTKAWTYYVRLIFNWYDCYWESFLWDIIIIHIVPTFGFMFSRVWSEGNVKYVIVGAYTIATMMMTFIDKVKKYIGSAFLFKI